jgi:hypothetical protein
VGRPCLDLAGEKVTGDDALSLTVSNDEVKHLGAVVHRHRTGINLCLEGLGAGYFELLTGLPAGVVGARNLHASERSSSQLTAIFSGERRADGVHMVNNPYRFGAESNNIGLSAPVVTTLDGVLDEPLKGIAVNLAGTCSVDTSLGSN